MADKGRVFVVQDMGFNYDDATHFGELIYLLSKKEANVFNMKRVTSLLRSRLWKEDFRGSDFLLAVGAPAIIMASGIEASKISSEFRVLQWDRIEKKYYSVPVRGT